MRPALAPGDLVLADTRPGREPSIRDLVVVRDPADPAHLLVKRVASRGERTFAMSSDNPVEARDSRHFGSLDERALVGRATLILTRTGRLRRPR